MMELSKHMDNDSLYTEIESQTHSPYSDLYLNIFLSFQGTFVSQVFQKVCKLQFSNIAYIWG